MSTIELKLTNFKCIKEGTFTFPAKGVVLLKGTNGSGKTTVLSGMAWAMYGSMRGVSETYNFTISGKQRKTTIARLTIPACLTASNRILHMKRTDRPSTFEAWFEGDAAEVSSCHVDRNGPVEKRMRMRLEGDSAEGIVDKEMGSKYLWKAFAFCPQTGGKGFLDVCTQTKFDILTGVCDRGDTPKRIMDQLSGLLRESIGEINMVKQELSALSVQSSTAQSKLEATYNGYDFFAMAHPISNLDEMITAESHALDLALDNVASCKVRCCEHRLMLHRRHITASEIACTNATLMEATANIEQAHNLMQLNVPQEVVSTLLESNIRKVKDSYAKVLLFDMCVNKPTVQCAIADRGSWLVKVTTMEDSWARTSQDAKAVLANMAGGDRDDEWMKLMDLHAAASKCISVQTKREHKRSLTELAGLLVTLRDCRDNLNVEQKLLENAQHSVLMSKNSVELNKRLYSERRIKQLDIRGNIDSKSIKLAECVKVIFNLKLSLVKAHKEAETSQTTLSAAEHDMSLLDAENVKQSKMTGLKDWIDTNPRCPCCSEYTLLDHDLQLVHAEGHSDITVDCEHELTTAVQLAVAKQKVDLLKRNRDATFGTIERLNGRLEERSHIPEILNGEKSELTHAELALAEDVAAVQQTIAEHQQALDGAEADCNSLSAAVSPLSSKYSQCLSNCSAYQKSMDFFHTDLMCLDASFAKLQDELDELDGQQLELEVCDLDILSVLRGDQVEDETFLNALLQCISIRIKCLDMPVTMQECNLLNVVFSNMNPTSRMECESIQKFEMLLKTFTEDMSSGLVSMNPAVKMLRRLTELDPVYILTDVIPSIELELETNQVAMKKVNSMNDTLNRLNVELDHLDAQISTNAGCADELHRVEELVRTHTIKKDMYGAIVACNVLSHNCDRLSSKLIELHKMQSLRLELKGFIKEASHYSLGELVEHINISMTGLVEQHVGNDYEIALKLEKILKHVGKKAISQGVSKTKPEVTIRLSKKGVEVGDIRSLSGGEREKIKMILYMCFNKLLKNKLVLVDESLSTLDSDSLDEMIDKIRNMYDGLVVMVNHRHSEGRYDGMIDMDAHSYVSN